ncbi:MAG: Spy/CpxP family protein refolding chaperone, partial [Bacteriovoracaceae bacterium]|nr:Spy/CpxP family protein refolding chaperone [Bacteriovoracaceae bacterium]
MLKRNFILTLILTLSLPLCLKAEHSSRHKPHKDNLQKLNLSDDQKKQLEQIQTDHQRSIKSILDQMAKQQKEKADLLADTQTDKDKVNKIDALNKEIADGHQALNLKRQERQTKVNAILTPEQRIQMEKNKMARKG